MKKLLLVFPYQVENKSEFNRIINKFDNNGYGIVNFEGISANFDLSQLPIYIEHAKKQVEGEVKQVAILSNVKEIIFSWYRSYNTLVDDFIYCIDGESQFLDDGQFYDQFYQQLSNFVGVKAEYLQGNIYFNINFENYKSIIQFLLLNNHFKYFDQLANFDFTNELTKEKVKKKYYYKGKNISFETDELTEKQDIVSLEEKSQSSNFQLNDKFKGLLTKDDNLYFIVFLIVELYNMRNKKGVNNFLVSSFEKLRGLDEEVRKSIFNQIMNYLDNKKMKVDFEKKLYLLSLLVSLRLKSKELSQKLLETLLEDKENLSYHYQVWVNLSFYRGKDNLQIYDDYYQDYKAEFDKIMDYFSQEINLPKQVERKEKRVAMVIHQLKNNNHSPTRLVFNYAEQLSKMYPEYEIKIFIEDVINFQPAEVKIPYYYYSSPSKKFSETHQKWIAGSNVEIYYSDPNKSRIKRTQDLVNEVVEFKPEVLWGFAKFSTFIDLLYPFYPTICTSLASDNYNVYSADAYLYKIKDEIFSKIDKYNLNLDKDKIYLHRPHEDYSDSYKDIKRSDYNIGDNEFLLVTVGNRLDVDLDKHHRYIDELCNLIEKNRDMKWMIVGPSTLSYLKKNYNNLLESNQIIRINYEDDLLALYEICDVYINPKRSGGGYSIGAAMSKETPIILFDNISDGLAVVGEENSVSSLEDYINRINLLYQDDEVRKQTGKLMRKKIKSFSENSLEKIFTSFEIAKNNFSKRNN